MSPYLVLYATHDNDVNINETHRNAQRNVAALGAGQGRGCEGVNVREAVGRGADLVLVHGACETEKKQTHISDVQLTEDVNRSRPAVRPAILQT
jgi:hypothetical protein